MSTYSLINAREDEVHLSGVETVSVGIHTRVVVNILLLGILIERNLKRDAGLEVRDVEGGVNSVL